MHRIMNSSSRQPASLVDILLRLPLLLVLFLTFVEAPLAYTCLPEISESGVPVTSHASSADTPCQFRDKAASHSDKDRCCVVEIEHDLRGAEYGTPIPSYSTPEPHQPDTGIVYTGYFTTTGSPGIPGFYSTYSTATPNSRHTYLVTRRLRI